MPRPQSSLVRHGLRACAAAALPLLAGCADEPARFTSLSQLNGRRFAVPTGTVADQLVLSRIPTAKFLYVPTVLAGVQAVQLGEADAVAYDEPILRNLAAKYPGFTVLSERITTDEYGFAARPADSAITAAVNAVLRDVKATGDYARIVARWLPASGAPGPMPVVPTGNTGVLRFGTAAVTEPCAYLDATQAVIGMDIEFAARTAAQLGRRLEVVNMAFGEMLPALLAGQVDLVGSCLTITEERKRTVRFSDSYYTGGISALVQR